MQTYLTDNQLAIMCVTILVLAALFLRIDGAKEIGLCACSGICGWLAKEEAKHGV